MFDLIYHAQKLPTGKEYTATVATESGDTITYRMTVEDTELSFGGHGCTSQTMVVGDMDNHCKIKTAVVVNASGIWSMTED